MPQTDQDRQFSHNLQRLCGGAVGGVDGLGDYVSECCGGRQIICRDPQCTKVMHCKRCTLNHEK